MTRCMFCGKNFEKNDGIYHAPVPDVDKEVLAKICPKCLRKLCNALRARGWR